MAGVAGVVGKAVTPSQAIASAKATLIQQNEKAQYKAQVTNRHGNDWEGEIDEKETESAFNIANGTQHPALPKHVITEFEERITKIKA